eukprot:2886269-Prymnesium_polylepis.1
MSVISARARARSCARRSRTRAATASGTVAAARPPRAALTAVRLPGAAWLSRWCVAAWVGLGLGFRG